MRTAAIALLLASCSGNPEPPSPSVQRYCGYFVSPSLSAINVSLYVPGFTDTRYPDHPDNPVVEDDWGLVRQDTYYLDNWIGAWSEHGGIPEVCTLAGPIDPDTAEGLVWLDYRTMETVLVDDLDAFLLTHR